MRGYDVCITRESGDYMTRTEIRDEAEKAARIIAKGGTPLEVATELPVFFIGYHEGIIRLWEALNRMPWRGNE